MRAFTDQWRRVLYVEDAAAMLLAMAERRLSGIYNVAGPELSSRYDFGLRLAHTFRLDETLIEPTRQAEFAYADPRPTRLDLSTPKPKAIDHAPDGPAQALRRMQEAEATLAPAHSWATQLKRFEPSP